MKPTFQEEEVMLEAKAEKLIVKDVKLSVSRRRSKSEVAVKGLCPWN
jgi:hypothetical protein